MNCAHSTTPPSSSFELVDLRDAVRCLLRYDGHPPPTEETRQLRKRVKLQLVRADRSQQKREWRFVRVFNGCRARTDDGDAFHLSTQHRRRCQGPYSTGRWRAVALSAKRPDHRRCRFGRRTDANADAAGISAEYAGPISTLQCSISIRWAAPFSAVRLSPRES